MLKMIETYEVYDQEKISARCEARFGEKVIGDRLSALYESVRSGEPSVAE